MGVWKLAGKYLNHLGFLSLKMLVELHDIISLQLSTTDRWFQSVTCLVLVLYLALLFFILKVRAATMYQLAVSVHISSSKINLYYHSMHCVKITPV